MTVDSLPILEVPAVSRIYYRVPVLAFADNGVPTPAGTAVPYFAFVKHTGDPASGDWILGDWQPGAITDTARVLVGPGGSMVLLEGRYTVWLRLLGSTEAPASRVGTLLVT